jgi:hypothetical protein
MAPFVTAALACVVLVAGSLAAADAEPGAATTSVCDAAEVLKWARSTAEIKLQTAVDVRVHNASGGCGLFAGRAIPHGNTILVRVRPEALIADRKHTSVVLRAAQLLAEVEGGNLSTVQHQHLDHVAEHWGSVANATKIECPLRIPALVLPGSVVAKCLPRHPRRLFQAAQAELGHLKHLAKTEVLGRGATFRTRHLKAAWAIVRTRAIDGPVDVTRPEETWTFLAPGIDLANMPSATGAANTRLEYQRTQAKFRSALNEAGDDLDAAKLAQPAPERPTRLDVLLTSVRGIRKGAELTLSYGNVRHPLDTLDTFGFVPGLSAAGANGSVIGNVSWTASLPLQLGFPEPKTRRYTGRHRFGRDAAADTYDEHQCRNESVMTFDPVTGKPSPSVITCLVIVHIQQRPSDDASFALRRYLGGMMSKPERQKLTAVAWGLLQFHANRTAVEEYSLFESAGQSTEGQNQRSACVAAVENAREKEAKKRLASPLDASTVDATLAEVAAVTQYMRAAYERLYAFAAGKAKALGEKTAPEHPPPEKPGGDDAGRVVKGDAPAPPVPASAEL